MLPTAPTTATNKAPRVHRSRKLCASGLSGVPARIAPALGVSLVMSVILGKLAGLIDAGNAVRQDNVLVRLGRRRRHLLIAEGQLPFASPGCNGLSASLHELLELVEPEGMVMLRQDFIADGDLHVQSDHQF